MDDRVSQVQETLEEHGGLLVTDAEAAEVLEPGDRAFHRPASFAPAERPTVLRGGRWHRFLPCHRFERCSERSNLCFPQRTPTLQRDLPLATTTGSTAQGRVATPSVTSDLTSRAAQSRTRQSVAGWCHAPRLGEGVGFDPGRSTAPHTDPIRAFHPPEQSPPCPPSITNATNRPRPPSPNAPRGPGEHSPRS